MLQETTAIDPSKVAIYIRWSTDDQTQGTTLETQLESCQKYLAFKGWTYQEDLVFIDDGYSGGNLNRPGMTALRAKVKAGQVRCVVVAKLDRLSRSLLDTVKLVREEWADRCALYSTKEDFNTNTPVGQMIFNILVSFAEFERNLIRERTMSGRKKRAEQGRNGGQKYHYGYESGGHGNWVLNGWDDATGTYTGEAAVVRRIFDHYLAGMGGHAIADQLRGEGIPAPNGGLWSATSVYMILDQVAYRGTFVSGQWHKVQGRYRKGDAAQRIDGVIPPIVSEDEWGQVQKMRKERSTAPRRMLSFKSEFILTGLVRCAKCGKPLVGHTNGPKRYYRCNGERTYKTCDCGTIVAEDLEKAVVQEVRSVLSTDGLRLMVTNIEEAMRQNVHTQEHAVSSVRAELAALESQRTKLEKDYLSGDLDAKLYSRLTEKVEQDIPLCEKRLEEAQEALRTAADAKVDVGTLRSIAARLDAWDTLTKEEMRMVLRDVVAELSAYRPKVGSGLTSPVQMTWRPRLDLTKTGEVVEVG